MALPLEHDYLVVDAFTDAPYAGNPAAVVWLPSEQALNNEQRLKLAREFNLSETAFVQPAKDGAFGLRWFTPQKEVELCGHGTLATCRALSEWGRWSFDEPAKFETWRKGTLSATRRGSRFVLDFPWIPSAPVDVPELAASALGERVAITEAAKSAHSLLLRVSSETDLADLRPNIDRLAQLHPHGVCVTAESKRPGMDFVSRFFAPNFGIAEDPVCGSAHCALGPFWRARLNKNEFSARQLSARGGTVMVRCLAERHRIELAGDTAITFRGRLTAP